MEDRQISEEDEDLPDFHHDHQQQWSAAPEQQQPSFQQPLLQVPQQPQQLQPSVQVAINPLLPLSIQAAAGTTTPQQQILQQQILLAQQAAAAAGLLQQQQQQQQPTPILQQQALLAASALIAAPDVTHNLIPEHLQGILVPPSLNGTPGHRPALIIPALTALPVLPTLPIIPIPALAVQDRPHIPPVYNGINVIYPGVRLLNVSPPVYLVENFLSDAECDFMIQAATDSFGPAPVVGQGAGEISPSRTSSTCYLAREDLPDYLRKVSLLTGKPIDHCELPQVGRYLPSQQYLQHFDAFDLSTEDGRRFAANGGQRIVTVLVYLNDVAVGGATSFPALNLSVQPRKGTALVFFPATIDGLLDRTALHAAMPAVDTKFISQVWIRQSTYNGQPSKRLSHTMGVPFAAVP